MQCFRLLTEYYSFLSLKENVLKITAIKFPSPYGVLFILICSMSEQYTILFFINGFRLLTEYYSFFYEVYTYGIKCYTSQVSVSLRSIIQSYQWFSFTVNLIAENSFRLLTEYYSFL